MKDMYSFLKDVRLIPVIVIDELEKVDAVGDALVSAGVPCAEITFRTPCAGQAIQKLAARGDLRVGAGTVINEEQAQCAIDAGAEFIVSPGISIPVIRMCREKYVAAIPGVCTPTEIMTAIEEGVTWLKFFPAEAAGGVAALKAFASPFSSSGITFVPTGGIGPNNISEYLALECVSACGASWPVKRQLILDGAFDTIRERAEQMRTMCQK